MAYACAAAATTPFSGAADLLTGLPIVVLVGLAVWGWPLHPRPFRPPGRHPLRAWAVLGVATLAWEVAAYAARGSRGAHPTFSSMADALDRHYVLKAILFFAWLCLCASIVLAGTAGQDA